MNDLYRNNNFDVLRIFLACMVFIYHMDVLTGTTSYNIFPTNFAVEGFFIISGSLITQSFLKNGNLKVYFLSRFFRIAPLYFIVVVVCFLSGVLITNVSLSEYFHDGGWDYLFYNLIFLNFLQPNLPGVFDVHNLLDAINGSLWTIKVEIMFYFTVPFIFGLGLRFFKINHVIVFIYLMSLLSYYLIDYFIKEYSLNPSFNNQLPSLMSYFMVGASFCLFNRATKWVFYFIPLAIVYMYITEIAFIHPVMVGFVVYFLAFRLPVLKVSKKIGDISYGVYLWHFPVIQILIYKGWFDLPVLGFVSSITITLILALVSWHYIESPLISRAKKKHTKVYT